MRDPLLITGCPRSGTSLTAHAFRACGLWTGGTTTQCENPRLRQEVLKPLLREGGMDDLALRSWADVEVDPDWLRRQVRAKIERGGYRGGPWLYKDVKLVFCWRSWAEAFPDATWVTVWRDPDEIVESFRRWGMSRKIDFDGWDVVLEHHQRAIQIDGAIRVHPDRLMTGDDSDYRAVADAYGIDWNPGEVAKVVDPEKYHVAGG